MPPRSAMSFSCPAAAKEDRQVALATSRRQAELIQWDVAQTRAVLKRSASIFRSLCSLSWFLKQLGGCAEEALSLVQPWQMWVFQVQRATSLVVGILHKLAQVTANALEPVLHLKATTPLLVVKREFELAAKSLRQLDAFRTQARAQIEHCDQLASQAVLWNGQEKKLQHVVFHVIENFGGGAACEALEAELQQQQSAVNKAEADVHEAVQKVEQISNEIDCLRHGGLITGRLAEAECELSFALEQHAVLTSALTTATDDMRESRDRCVALRTSFRGLDLHEIGVLQDGLQELPQLLQEQGMNDHGMFSILKGQVKDHELLCRRFEQFFEEDEELECRRMLSTMQSEIASFIQGAKSFNNEQQFVKNEIQSWPGRANDIGSSSLGLS